LTWLKPLAILWTAAAFAHAAADLQVYSEFRRIGPDGAIVPADRGGPVREILSPRVLRGGWATFQIVVTGPPGTEFWLYIGQNPDNAAAFQLYRASFSGGLPDRLEKVSEPAHAEIPAGQSAAVFWLDLKYPYEYPAGRVKLEPQLFLPSEERWVVYPMEVNVTPARAHVVIERVSDPRRSPRADSAAIAAWRSLRCKSSPALTEATIPPATVLGLIERNARQDLSLLRRLSPNALAELLPDSFCSGEIQPETIGRQRDRLYRLLQESSKLKETDP
jgi:hypothetical protein